MSSILRFAIIIMFSALGLYSIGVWSEKIQGELKWWHLLFFWAGFAADTIGTSIMSSIAGEFTLSAHSITGITAIILMFVHATWATIVLLQKNENAVQSFHKFSISVWIIWLIPFVTGLMLPMVG